MSGVRARIISVRALFVRWSWMPETCSRRSPVPAGDDRIGMTFDSLFAQEVDLARDLMPVKRIWWHSFRW